MPSKKSASPARGHAPARPPKAAAHEITLQKYLGRALREHRQHALSISQVAELMRINSRILSKIEQGQVAPTLDVIERTG
jgi:ribosome-binding protein aMBF1 (putative translation factor)